MVKNVFKYLLWILGIVVLVYVADYGIKWIQYRYSPEYKESEEAWRLIKEFNEDPYGGDTPEETMRLFVEALKKEDFKLASKYFIEDHAEWGKYLKEVKDEGKLQTMIDELGRTKLTAKEETAFFTLVDKNNVVESTLVMHRKQSNKKWKISEL